MSSMTLKQLEKREAALEKKIGSLPESMIVAKSGDSAATWLAPPPISKHDSRADREVIGHIKAYRKSLEPKPSRRRAKK